MSTKKIIPYFKQHKCYKKLEIVVFADFATLCLYQELNVFLTLEV